jgi:hypothetical protein
MKTTIANVTDSKKFYVETIKWDKAKRQFIEKSYVPDGIFELHKLIEKIYK